MRKPANALPMDSESRAQLEAWIHNPTTSPRVVLRANICLLASSGIANEAIASRLGTSRPTVIQWRKRFAKSGPAGIAADAPRGPSSLRLPEETVRAIIEMTLKTKPPKGTKRWSTRTLAMEAGVANATVARIWHAYGLNPQRWNTTEGDTRSQPAITEKVSGPRTHRKRSPANCKDISVTHSAPTAGKAEMASRAGETYDVLRARIAALPCGAQLPSVAKIRSELGVSQDTVSKALARLESQGWIERKWRKGVYVTDHLATGEIAIVLHPRLLRADAHPYYTFVNEAIINRLHAHNPRWHIRIHVVKSAKTTPKFQDLLEPEVLRNLRGIFSFTSLHDIRPFLTAAEVPVVSLGSREPPAVTFNDATPFTLGLAHLREAGCETVGMIWNTPSEQGMQADFRMVNFCRAAAAHGFDIRPEWTTPVFEAATTEQNGYKSMVQFWKKRPHPDGVLVADDDMCRGVLRASLQLGIDFPRDIRLVTQANRGIALPYHKSVSRVEYDPAEQARLAVTMMLTLIDGRTPPDAIVELPGIFIKGETT